MREDRSNDRSRRQTPPILRRAIAPLLVTACVLARPVGLPAQTCVGDTDGDGAVAVNELITGVRIALGLQPLSTAPSFDADGDGSLRVNELVVAVANTLDGCALPPGPDRVGGSARVVTNDAGALEILDIGGAAATSRSTLGLARMRAAPHAAGAGCSTGVQACEEGTRRVESCTVSGGHSLLVESFTDCAVHDPAADTVLVLNGRRARDVEDPDFCNTCVIGAGVAETLTFTGFSVDLNCSRDCPPGFQNGVVRAASLTARRRPDPASPADVVTLTGGVRVENRLTGEVLDQTVSGSGLVMTSAPTADGTMVKFNGGVAVGCLGPLEFTTESEIVFASGAKCPGEGAYEVALPNRLDGAASRGAGGAAAADPAGRRGGDRASGPFGAGVGGGEQCDSGFRQTLFRALDGHAYQVLQNSGGDPVCGGEDVRVTTFASSAVLVDQCAELSTNRAVPQVAAVAGRDPLALDDAARSVRIADSTPPCFAPAAQAGAGSVCIGPDCQPETCVCAGPSCATFTFADGLRLDQAAPAVQLVGPQALSSDCASLVAGEMAYATGGGPTTEAAACDAEPADGLLLSKSPSAFTDGHAGSTVIIGYDASFGLPFFVGAGGFAIDRDGENRERCPRNRVVPPAFAFAELGFSAPRVRFAPTSVQIDLNADERIDDTLASCEDPAVVRCVPRPLATPTPNVNCATFDLGSGLTASHGDTTGADSFGGASCGGGGTGASDFAFSFKPRTSGFYVIDTLDAATTFDTVLYVRRGGCGGEEVACNDDASLAARQSQLGVFLDAGEPYLIVVDSFHVEGGHFQLNLRFASATAPTPTPTPTARSGVNPPDLSIDALTTRSMTGAAGGQLEVSAQVANHPSMILTFPPPPSPGPAGPFRLDFFFSTDPVISADDIPSGSGCRFAGLNAGGASLCRGAIDIPATLPAGTYYVGAIADPDDRVAEQDETNNGRSADSPIAISGNAATFTPTVPPPTPTPTVPLPTATPTVPPPTATPTIPAPTPTPTVTGPTATITPAATSSVTATAVATTTPSTTATATPTRTPTRSQTFAFDPRAAAVAPGEEIALRIRLPAPALIDTMIDLAVLDPGIASLGAMSVTIHVGESSGSVTVQGVAEGATTLTATGPATATATIYVTPPFSGMTLASAAAVSVEIPQQPSGEGAVPSLILAGAISVEVAPGSGSGTGSGTVAAPITSAAVAVLVPAAPTAGAGIISAPVMAPAVSALVGGG